MYCRKKENSKMKQWYFSFQGSLFVLVPVGFHDKS